MPFDEAERWFKEAFRRPLSLLSRRKWPWTRMSELEEISPSVDIFEKGNDVMVKAELPGMKKEDTEVSVTDHTMRISGEKKREEKIEMEDEAKHHFMLKTLDHIKGAVYPYGQVMAE